MNPLRNTHGGQVLAIGCGSRFHDLLIAQSEDITHVTGIDYSIASVVRADLAFPHPQAMRFVADYGDPDAGGFDTVVGYCEIEHLNDWQSFMDSCRGLVRPGGLVGCTFQRIDKPNINHLLASESAQFSSIPSISMKHLYGPSGFGRLTGAVSSRVLWVPLLFFFAGV